MQLKARYTLNTVVLNSKSKYYQDSPNQLPVYCHIISREERANNPLGGNSDEFMGKLGDLGFNFSLKDQTDKITESSITETVKRDENPKV